MVKALNYRLSNQLIYVRDLTPVPRFAAKALSNNIIKSLQTQLFEVAMKQIKCIGQLLRKRLPIVENVYGKGENIYAFFTNIMV
jgi:hypothetical protein